MGYINRWTHRRMANTCISYTSWFIQINIWKQQLSSICSSFSAFHLLNINQLFLQANISYNPELHHFFFLYLFLCSISMYSNMELLYTNRVHRDFMYCILFIFIVIIVSKRMYYTMDYHFLLDNISCFSSTSFYLFTTDYIYRRFSFVCKK